MASTVETTSPTCCTHSTGRTSPSSFVAPLGPDLPPISFPTVNLDENPPITAEPSSIVSAGDVSGGSPHIPADDLDQLMDSDYDGPWSIERFHEEMGIHYETLQESAHLAGDVEMDDDLVSKDTARPTTCASLDEQLPQKKKRKMWTDQETKDLLKGCAEHGIGKWKKILDDKKYMFDHRTSIDLKDR